MRAGSRRRAARGYGFVAVLVLLAMASLGLAGASEAWRQSGKREREQELMRIGQLYVQALTRYRDSSPGRDKKLPLELEELLLDPRFVGRMRHLRQLYPDPVTRSGEWVLIRDDAGRIRGVHSASEEAPLAQGGIERPGLRLPPATTYAGWKFVVEDKL